MITHIHSALAHFYILDAWYMFAFQLDKETQTERTVPLVCGISWVGARGWWFALPG